MRILITGATGQLGPYIVQRLLHEQHRLALWSRHAIVVGDVTHAPVELTDAASVRESFRSVAPDVIVHCAAISNLHEALRAPDRTLAVNVEATRLLAELAAERDAKLIYLSTDLVFDGERGRYAESDAPRPLSVYAHSKLAGEAFVTGPRGLVLRLPLVLGLSRRGQVKFFDQLVASLRDSKPVTLFDDEWRTPVSPVIVAEAVATAIQHDAAGLFHLAGPDRLSRYDMGVRLARIMGVDHSSLVPASRLSVATAEPRPRDTSLDAGKWHARFPQFPRPGFDESMRAVLTFDDGLN